MDLKQVQSVLLKVSITKSVHVLCTSTLTLHVQYLLKSVHWCVLYFNDELDDQRKQQIKNGLKMEIPSCLFWSYTHLNS